MPVVPAVYVAAVVAMVLAFQAFHPSEAVRGGVVAAVICLAAIPLEQIGHRWRRALPFLVALYVVAFAISFFLLNLRISIEWAVLALLGAAFVAGKIKTFVMDWSVFIAVLIAWQVTDGLASDFHFPLHIRAMIHADRFMFGRVPTVWLQQHLFHANQVSWYDVMSVIIYSLHFLLPLSAGFILWLLNRQLYYRYAICFAVAAVLGFVTYILYPAVPPWMAVNHCPNINGTWACDASNKWQHFLPWFYKPKLHHWVPGVYDVWNHTMSGWLSKNHGNVTFGSFRLGFDQVAAIPSEHTMYPWLVFLFFRKQFGRIGYLMVGYVCLVLFAVVYTGQHYVIDGIAGIVYASVVYVLVMVAVPWLMARTGWRSKRRLVPVPIPAQPPRTEDLVAMKRSERIG